MPLVDGGWRETVQSLALRQIWRGGAVDPEEDDGFWPSAADWNVGACGFQAYPEGLLTQTELKAWRKELRERRERRKPMGFHPWPEEEG